jgi:hypothetical protein
MLKLQKQKQQTQEQQMKKQKYFIFDCLGGVVGNQKGYRTFRGAQRMRNNQAVQDVIWSTYYSNRDKELTLGISPDVLSNHLSSIKLVEVFFLKTTTKTIQTFN